MVNCWYRGVTAFVCMNALCGSVIRLLLIVIVVKRSNNGNALAHKHRGGPKTTAKALKTVLNGKNNE